MHKVLRLALVQYAYPGNMELAMEAVSGRVRAAAAQGAALVVLPEFSLLPYFPGRLEAAGERYAEPLEGRSGAFFAELARACGVALIGSVYERGPEGRLYNTALMHDAGGRRVGSTRKQHIPSGEGYHETQHFEGGGAQPLLEWEGLRLATPTCYDQWFPEVARLHALAGAELLAYPTAIGSEPGDPGLDSQEAWQTVMRGHAAANGLFVCAVNRVGVENGVTFYGSSFACGPGGELLTQASRSAEETVYADLDPARLERWRRAFPLLHQRRPELYRGLLERHTATQPPAWLELPEVHTLHEERA